MLMMNRLSKVYRTESVETHALRDFNINVRDREFVAVTGPSGSGKTTFLTVAGLLEEFTSGEFQLDGINVRGMDDGQRSRMRNEKIGFVFQAFNLIPDLTVSANVELPLHYRSMTRGERRVGPARVPSLDGHERLAVPQQQGGGRLAPDGPPARAGRHVTGPIPRCGRGFAGIPRT